LAHHPCVAKPLINHLVIARSCGVKEVVHSIV
jgi:hypothetical protein